MRLLLLLVQLRVVVQVKVRHYYVRCIADYCAAAAAAADNDDIDVSVETDTAVCQTLDSYSELCVARHSAFSWRTATLCRMLT